MQSDLSRYVKSVCVFSILVQCTFDPSVGQNITTVSYDVSHEIRNKPVDWKKANTECMPGGFTLASKQKTETWIEFIQAISPLLLPNTKVWIDYTVEYTPWLSEEGCYKRQGQFKTHKHKMANNHRGICAQKCFKDFSYFALKGEQCTCFYEKKTLVNANRKMCNIPCPGEKTQVCGGNKVASLYKFETFSRFEEDKGLCVTYKRTYRSRGTKEMWGNSPCWMLHHFICDVNGTYTIPPYKANWTEADSSCTYSFFGSLARDEENDQILNSIMKNETMYWVGKFRDVSTIRGKEKNRNSLKKCLTFVRGFGDWINTEEEDCTEKYRPLCQKAVPVISNTYNKVKNGPMATEVTMDHCNVLMEELATFQVVVYVLLGFVVVCIIIGIILRCREEGNGSNNMHLN